jgi:hypothetical protein
MGFAEINAGPVTRRARSPAPASQAASMRTPFKFLMAKFLTATVIAALSAGSARAEWFNEFEAVFGLSDTMFTLVFKGNIVSSINTSAMVGDTTVNPFAYVDTKILHVATPVGHHRAGGRSGGGSRD